MGTHRGRSKQTEAMHDFLCKLVSTSCEKKSLPHFQSKTSSFQREKADTGQTVSVPSRRRPRSHQLPDWLKNCLCRAVVWRFLGGCGGRKRGDKATNCPSILCRRRSAAIPQHVLPFSLSCIPQRPGFGLPLPPLIPRRTTASLPRGGTTQRQPNLTGFLLGKRSILCKVNQ